MSFSSCHQSSPFQSYETHFDLEPDIFRQLLDLVQAELDRAFAFRRRRRILEVPEKRTEVDPYTVFFQQVIDDTQESDDIPCLK